MGPGKLLIYIGAATGPPGQVYVGDKHQVWGAGVKHHGTPTLLRKDWPAKKLLISVGAASGPSIHVYYCPAYPAYDPSAISHGQVTCLCPSSYPVLVNELIKEREECVQVGHDLRPASNV